MKNTSNKNKVKCLFGYHNYTIPNKECPEILMCNICERFGYSKWSGGLEIRYEYDKKGNEIYRKYSSGCEIRYDEKGNIIHFKYSSGNEEWYEYDEKENMIHFKNSSGREEWYDGEEWKSVKPKNWKYEKHIK